MGPGGPQKPSKALQNKGFEQKCSSFCNQNHWILLKTIGKTRFLQKYRKTQFPQNLETLRKTWYFDENDIQKLPQRSKKPYKINGKWRFWTSKVKIFDLLGKSSLLGHGASPSWLIEKPFLIGKPFLIAKNVRNLYILIPGKVDHWSKNLISSRRYCYCHVRRKLYLFIALGPCCPRCCI